jgi:hypothetical protein
MPRLFLGLFSFVLVASPQSAPDAVRRLDFAQEKFSIAIPAAWRAIEPPVLAVMEAAIPQAAPNLPKIKLSHGFTPAAAPPLYP